MIINIVGKTKISAFREAKLDREELESHCTAFLNNSNAIQCGAIGA